MLSRTLNACFARKNAFRAFSQQAKAAQPVSTTVIEVRKSNLSQSPFKMRFLAMLIRGLWLPDALAQLKYSPKHKAVDLAKMVKRGLAIAKINYDAVPEELFVKEIFVTKGSSYRKIRIMGRGRAGIGKIRSTHVRMKIDKLDFDKRIQEARSPNEKKLWQHRKYLADKLRKRAVSPPPAPVTPLLA